MKRSIESLEEEAILNEEIQSKIRKNEEQNIQKMLLRMKRHTEKMKQQSMAKQRNLLKSPSTAGSDELKGINNVVQVEFRLSQLEYFPDEILKVIIELFDLGTLIICSSVSKRLHSLCQDEQIWKMLYEKTWTISPTSSPNHKSASSHLYRDLFNGETVLWKVSFRKRRQKELTKRRIEERIQKTKELNKIQCKYCLEHKAIIVGSTNNSSQFLVSNKTPRYSLSIECKSCARKWIEGRGEDGDQEF